MVSIQAHSGTKSSACAQPHADTAAHPSMYNSQKKKKTLSKHYVEPKEAT